MACPSGTMSKTEVEELLRRYSVEVGEKLLAGYGLQLQPGELSSLLAGRDLSLLGIIGFTGRQIAGTLVMGATKEPIEASRPRDSTCRDWVAELANQLLGGVKNRVLSHGIEFYAVPPTVVSGAHLTPVTSKSSFEPVTFSCAGGIVCLWIEIEVADPYLLGPATDASEIPEEGEVLLF